MKAIFIALCILLLPVVGPPALGQGFLRADGPRIVDGQGREIILRGMGLGGWMLQEGYMLRTSGPQYNIEARVAELVGPERKAAFYDAWLARAGKRAAKAWLAERGLPG